MALDHIKNYKDFLLENNKTHEDNIYDLLYSSDYNNVTLAFVMLSGMPDLVDKLSDDLKLHFSLCLEYFPQYLIDKEVIDVSDFNDVDRIGDMSPNIKYMKKLYQIFVPDKGITSLPKSIGLLKKLKVLDIMWNNIPELPKSITKCVSLNKIGLDGNQLTSLPSGLKNLKGLKELYINNNQISKLPNDFSQINSLEILDLGYNAHLKELPDDFRKLTNLKKLNLYGTPINAHIAYEYISGMDSITELSVNESSDDDLVKLSDSLPNLVHIYADSPIEFIY